MWVCVCLCGCDYDSRVWLRVKNRLQRKGRHTHTHSFHRMSKEANQTAATACLDEFETAAVRRRSVDRQIMAPPTQATLLPILYGYLTLSLSLSLPFWVDI